MLPPQMMGPPDQQQGPPPELLAALMGGAGAGQAAPPDQEQQMSSVDHLRAAIEHAQAALVGEPDDADSQALAKAVQGLYQILASRQKEQDSLVGGNQRALRRAAG